MNDNELISVIIPTYNRAKLIEKSIESVLLQTYDNLEVLVIDDCSTDNTREVVSSIDDKRVKYIKLNTNVGPAGARNEGILRANGKYIAFQDSDDLWHEDKLELEMKEMQSDMECQLVFCRYLSKGKEEVIVPAEESFNVDAYSDGMFEILIGSNRIGTPTILVKKSVLEQVGGFNETLVTWEDWELALRIASVGKIKYVNKVLMDVYPSEDGVNQIEGWKRVETVIYILKEFWNQYENKQLFNSLIRVILAEFKYMTKEEQNSCLKQLDMMDVSERYADIICLLEEELRLLKIDQSYNADLFRREHYKKEMLDNLITAFSDGSLCQKLRKESKNKIAIYGLGEVGKQLVSLAIIANVDILYTIDRKPRNIMGIPSYTIETMPDSVDMIIITTYDPKQVIKESLKKCTQCSLKYIQEILV